MCYTSNTSIYCCTHCYKELTAKGGGRQKFEPRYAMTIGTGTHPPFSRGGEPAYAPPNTILTRRVSHPASTDPKSSPSRERPGSISEVVRARHPGRNQWIDVLVVYRVSAAVTVGTGDVLELDHRKGDSSPGSGPDGDHAEILILHQSQNPRTEGNCIRLGVRCSLSRLPRNHGPSPPKIPVIMVGVDHSKLHPIGVPAHRVPWRLDLVIPGASWIRSNLSGRYILCTQPWSAQMTRTEGPANRTTRDEHGSPPGDSGGSPPFLLVYTFKKMLFGLGFPPERPGRELYAELALLKDRPECPIPDPGNPTKRWVELAYLLTHPTIDSLGPSHPLVQYSRHSKSICALCSKCSGNDNNHDPRNIGRDPSTRCYCQYCELCPRWRELLRTGSRRMGDNNKGLQESYYTLMADVLQKTTTSQGTFLRHHVKSWPSTHPSRPPRMDA